MMDRGEADICAAACEGTHATAGRHALKEVASHRQPTQERVPGRILQPWKGVHTGTGFLAGTVAPGEPTLEESVSDGLYPLQRTQAAAVLQVLQAVGGAQSRALNEVSYGKDPTLEQGNSFRGKEQQRRNATYTMRKNVLMFHVLTELSILGLFEGIDLH